MLPSFIINFLVICSVVVSGSRADFVRDVAKRQGVARFTTIQNAILTNDLAFTSADLKHIYIDFERFKDAPRALINTLKHELAHAKGAQHGDGSFYMSYAVTLDGVGNVVDDVFALP